MRGPDEITARWSLHYLWVGLFWLRAHELTATIGAGPCVCCPTLTVVVCMLPGRPIMLTWIDRAHPCVRGPSHQRAR